MSSVGLFDLLSNQLGTLKTRNDIITRHYWMSGYTAKNEIFTDLSTVRTKLHNFIEITFDQLYYSNRFHKSQITFLRSKMNLFNECRFPL